MCNTEINVVVNKQKSINTTETTIKNTIQLAYQNAFDNNVSVFNGNVDQTSFSVALKTSVPQIMSAQFDHTYMMAFLGYKLYFDNAISSVEITGAKYANTELTISQNINGDLFAFSVETGKQLFSYKVGQVDFNSGVINITRTDLINVSNAIAIIRSRYPTIKTLRNNFLRNNNVSVNVNYG